MRVKINSTGEIKEVKQVGDKLFDKENNCYLLGQVTVLEEWHPASEKPIIPKDKEDIWVYCLVYGEDKDDKVLAPMFLRYTKLLTLGWVLPDDMIVVWWCYPPQND